MEKPELLKRGIYKKAAQRSSPNNVVKNKIRGVQEKIGQLREIKPADKFLHELDLRPRLRKSMLIRAVKNADKNIISSTPHHTKNTNDQPFFGNNVSVLLSPISLGRLSNNAKNELRNDVKDGRVDEQKAALTSNADDSSSEIMSRKNSTDSPRNHDSSLIYVGTEIIQGPQELQMSLRKSKKEQITNRSKIQNKVNHEVKKDSKKLKVDKSFDSHKNSCLKETDESLKKVSAQQPVKSSRTNQTGIKTSRIPVRTASEEKERCVDVNNSLSKLEEIITRSKSESSKKLVNTKDENKTPTRRYHGKENPHSISTHVRNSNKQNNNVQKNLTFGQGTQIDLNLSSKKPGLRSSTNTPNRNKSVLEKEIDVATDKDNNIESQKKTPVHPDIDDKRQTPRKQRKSCSQESIEHVVVPTTRVVSSKSSGNTLGQDGKSLAKEVNDFNANSKDNHSENDIQREPDHLNPKNTSRHAKHSFNKDAREANSTNNNTNNKDENNDHGNRSDRTEFVDKTPRRRNNETISSQLHNPSNNNNNTNEENDDDNRSTDRSVHDRTEFVNKTPRRRNNETLSSQLHNPVNNEYANIPIIITEEAHSRCENVDLINKSRPSTVRRKPADRCDDLDEVLTTSVGLSPIIDKLIAEISAKKNERMTLTSNRRRPTVNREIQTSMNNSPKNSYLQSLKARSRSSIRSRFAEQMTQTSIDKPFSRTCDSERSNSYSRGSSTNVSESNFSSGVASDILGIAYDVQTRYSQFKHNIFESLEEGNELDGLDFTESGEPEMSVLEKPWRFVNDGLVPEKSNTINLSFIPAENQINDRLSDRGVSSSVHNRLQSSIGYSGSSDDSRNSSPSPKNKTLRYSNSLVQPISKHLPETLNRDTALSRTGRRQYRRKSHRMTEKQVHPPSPSNSSKRISAKKAFMSKASKMSGKDNRNRSLGIDNSLSTDNKSQKIMQEQIHLPNETVSVKITPTKQSFTAKASERSRHHNRNLHLESAHFRNTNDKSQKNVEEDVHQPNETISSLKRTPAQKTFISKASKGSKKGNKKIHLERASSSDTENIIVSLSSADKQLLGVRRLSDVGPSNEETGNLESDPFNIHINEKFTTKAKQSSASLSKKQKGAGLQSEPDIQELANRQSVPTIACTDLSNINKENNLTQLQEEPTEYVVGVNEPLVNAVVVVGSAASLVESNNNKSSPRQSPLTGVRKKSTKKRGTKNESVVSRSAMVTINQSNIIQVVGEGRPQRNRRPVRYLTDINLDYIVSERKKLDLKTDHTTSRRSKKPKASEAASKKMGRPKKGKSKLKTPGKSVSTKEYNATPIPDGNILENVDNVANRHHEGLETEKGMPPEEQADTIEDDNNIVSPGRDFQRRPGRTRIKILKLPVTSEEPAREQGTSNKSQQSCLGETQSNMENESMPPPKGCSTNTSTGRKRIRRNLTADSGFEITNKSTNKNLTNNTIQKMKLRKRATSETDQNAEDHVECRIRLNVEQASTSDLPTSEPLIQSERTDHIENTSSSDRVSVVEQSLTKIKTRGVTKTHKKQHLAKDVADKLSRALEKVSESSRDLEGSSVFSELPIDGSRRRSSSFQFITNDYISYMVDHKLYSLRYVNRPPSDAEYRALGDLDVTQTVKDPRDNFSAGYVRLQPGGQKRPTTTTKYSFVYVVISGCGWVQCHNRTSTVQQGDFFVIPIGMEYSIRNINSQSDLILSYTKVKPALNI